VKFLAARTLLDAVVADIHKIRPKAEVVHRKGHVFCIERTPHGIVTHFITSMIFDGLKIYCAKPAHPYVTLIRPSSGPGSAQFTGHLKYTNLLTGNVVKTAYLSSARGGCTESSAILRKGRSRLFDQT
jgi:hypothetical protein